MTRDSKTGRRNFFYGPLPKHEAEDYAERMLEEGSLLEDLVSFLQHDFSPGELEYRIQVIAESIEERTKQDPSSPRPLSRAASSSPTTFRACRTGVLPSDAISPDEHETALGVGA